MELAWSRHFCVRVLWNNNLFSLSFFPSLLLCCFFILVGAGFCSLVLVDVLVVGEEPGCEAVL